MSQATNRRSLLGLLAAAPVVATLPASAQASPHPDAEILDLERQHAISEAAAERLSDRAEELREVAQASRPAPPAALIVRPDDWCAPHNAVGLAFSSVSVARWRVLLTAGNYRENMTPGLADRFATRGGEVVRAWEAHRAAVETHPANVRAREASELASAAWRVHHEIEDRLFAIRTTTPEGWRVKARLLSKLIGDPDGTYEDALTRNLLADLAPERV